ncbi:MAG: hypothetical protein JXQ73_18985 [Phycisphaerae bacterium]|nr:hypothetical protein [Phycisphaerae bacterium]
MNKRAIIVALVGVNLLLAGGLILMAYEPPSAYAQGVGRGGNYVMVSGRIEESLDALYVLNLDRQVVDVVLVNKQGNQPEIVGRRPGPDLVSDLRQQRQPVPAETGRRRR